MSEFGINIITDAVNKITVVMRDDKFSKEGLNTILKVFKAGVAATENAINKANKQEPKNPDHDCPS